MTTLLSKVLPFADKGILLQMIDFVCILRGFREDVDLAALQAELEAEWLDLCKEEAAIRVKNALATAKESQRPANFADLTTKLNLGRINPEEQQALNAYYDTVDALEQEAAALREKIAKAKNVETINKIPWPEWVGWEALPLKAKLEVIPTKQEQNQLEPSNK
ncbi:hypothetical protein [Meiothermus taiwanensis]|jgi:hypothetical protein|uniref:hypothetical protein n=1 Tax=Meiothermus taiwanensis TaxID=172827 RepID=UPI0005B71832|nr:hypothetical protein [Meiothermus taiwanensis]KIQ54286.1 hypothetical protein SY28_09435 [Meiothermus taiwanensis]